MSDAPVRNETSKKGEGAAARKKDAFETFFRLTYSRLCSYAFGIIHNRDEAEDIVQSTFLKVWEQKDFWDDFESAKAYMYRSVRNRALNHKKHEKVKRASRSEIRSRMAEWKTPLDCESARKRKMEIIQKGIRKLPTRRREIFKMSRESGLTYREIADTLGISIKTVETQIGRSLKYLRAYVDEHNLVVILFMVISVL